MGMWFKNAVFMSLKNRTVSDSAPFQEVLCTKCSREIDVQPDDVSVQR